MSGMASPELEVLHTVVSRLDEPAIPSAYRRREFERRRRTRVDDQDMWIASPEDLVLSKLVWAKEAARRLPKS